MTRPLLLGEWPPVQWNGKIRASDRGDTERGLPRGTHYPLIPFGAPAAGKAHLNRVTLSTPINGELTGYNLARIMDWDVVGLTARCPAPHLPPESPTRREARGGTPRLA